MISYLCEYQTSQNKTYLWKKINVEETKLDKHIEFILTYLTYVMISLHIL